MTLPATLPDLPSSPAALRNRDPILALLRTVLPPSGLLLEIASGTGEHAVHIAAALPGLAWQPTDADQDMIPVVEARRRLAGLSNLRAPVWLDVRAPVWPVAHADAVLAVNMIHIAPAAATTGLLRGAARVLPAGGPLVLYGPFREADRPLAQGNVAFDESLRARDPDWGLRDLGSVVDQAARAGCRFEARHEMPANNLLVVFRRDAA